MTPQPPPPDPPLLIIKRRKVDTKNDDKDIFLAGQAISEMEKIKLSGVPVDNNLNFTSHMGELCTKASQKVGVPVRLRNVILCYAKLSLYKSSIQPHLTYCHLVWHFVDHQIEERSSGYIKIHHQSAKSSIPQQLSILPRTTLSCLHRRLSKHSV